MRNLAYALMVVLAVSLLVATVGWILGIDNPSGDFFFGMGFVFALGSACALVVLFVLRRRLLRDLQAGRFPKEPEPKSDKAA